MKEKLIQLANKKWFHICIIIIIISILISATIFITIKYNVEGERNMPFNVSKITIISSSEGQDDSKEISNRKYKINQNNDIYIYIEKNDNYGKETLIGSVKIENISIEKATEKGEVKIYRPDPDETKGFFENEEENLTEGLEYLSDIESNFKELKISNQGGIVVFRCANDNIAEYSSSEQEEINVRGLLKKVNGLSENDLKFKLNFDIIIKTTDLKEYKAQVSIDLPNEGVIEKDVSSIEKTDLENIIFKRIKN